MRNIDRTLFSKVDQTNAPGQHSTIRLAGMPVLNPCPAELLQLYFSSFEAGIAYAISSFK